MIKKFSIIKIWKLKFLEYLGKKDFNLINNVNLLNVFI